MQINSQTKALVTGAASGIGKIMTRRLLEKGADVVIWDINKEGIAQTVREFKSLGNIKAYTVDVSDEKKVLEITEKVLADTGYINLLFNNAGILTGKYFHEQTLKEINKTMEVNTLAFMRVAHGFLPKMIERKDGHICNITSAAGLIANPKMSVYVASKWATTGWSDSLRIEMKVLKTKVKVTTVTPFYISTGMFEGVKSPVLPILKPGKVVQKIIRGVQRNKIYVSMPLSMHFIRLVQGILPLRVFDFVVGSVLGIYHTMDHFRGKK